MWSMDPTYLIDTRGRNGEVSIMRTRPFRLAVAAANGQMRLARLQASNRLYSAE